MIFPSSSWNLPEASHRKRPCLRRLKHSMGLAVSRATPQSPVPVTNIKSRNTGNDTIRSSKIKLTCLFEILLDGFTSQEVSVLHLSDDFPEVAERAHLCVPRGVPA